MADLAGAEAVVEDAEEDEERRADDAFVEGLEDAAVEAGEGESVDAEGAEAEAADGAVGEQLPEVFLDQGEQRAVEDADGGQGDHPGRGLMGLDGEEADVEADERVEAELAGDDHGHGYGSFREGVGKPAVQAENGDFDREGDEEGKGSPAERRRQGTGRRRWRIAGLRTGSYVSWRRATGLLPAAAPRG